MVINRNKRAALLLSLAVTAPLADAACLGMQVHAHRGAAQLPENSLSALRAGYENGWDGIETDMQMLGDRQWVIHHDASTGRVVDSGQARPVRTLTSADWSNARMKQRGVVGSEAPPFLSDVTALASRHPEQALNAEIKDVTSCNDVQALVGQFAQSMEHGNWFLTSGVIGNLRCARQVDKRGYLGLIVFDPRNAQAAGANAATAFIARNARAPRLDAAWLSSVRQQIGMPVGVHVDARSLESNPALLADAAHANMPVFVYAVDGDAALASALKRARQRSGYWPTGVIVDDSAQSFCARVQ